MPAAELVKTLVEELAETRSGDKRAIHTP